MVAPKNDDCQLSLLLKPREIRIAQKTGFVDSKQLLRFVLEIRAFSMTIQPHGLAILGEADSGGCSTTAAGGKRDRALPARRAERMCRALSSPSPLARPATLYQIAAGCRGASVTCVTPGAKTASLPQATGIERRPHSPSSFCGALRNCLVGAGEHLHDAHVPGVRRTERARAGVLRASSVLTVLRASRSGGFRHYFFSDV